MATGASGAPKQGKSRAVEKRSRISGADKDPAAPRPQIRIPDGVVDHPPESAAALDAHQNTIAYVFDLFGYERVKTPMFELLETLEVGLGVDAKSAAFRLVDPATGEVGVLRPDFTAQIARMVSSRLAGVVRPLRLSYAGRIARAADPLGRGLYSREVFQAGIEMIGGPDQKADAEILSIGAECFRALGRKVTIDLGHSAIVEALMSDGDPVAIGRALAAKDPTRVGALDPGLLPLLDLYGDHRVLERARRELPTSTHEAIDGLEAAADQLTREHPEVAVTFDLGERRSLGYYTGLFFAGYVEGAPDAVMSGGRYDELLGRFGPDETAVGLAIDVGAIAASRPKRQSRRGVVAGHGLEAEVEKRRRRGERAVLVDVEDVRAYALAHGFQRTLQRDPATGEILEERLE